MIKQIIEVILLLLFSAVKFLFSPGVVVARGFNWFETVLITTLGGWLGVFVFFYFGKILTELWLRFRRKRATRIRKKRKTFSWRNKFIIKVKSKFGILGLAFITPVVLSIPIGSMLAARFFSDNKMTLPVLMTLVLFWSLVLTTLVVNLGWLAHT